VNEWFGDFSARWRQGRDRSRARRAGFDAAVAAVRAAVAGKTRSEVRELLMTELRARDFAPTPDPVLEYLVDRVLAPADVLSQVRLTGRGLRMVAGNAVNLSQLGGGPHMDLGDAEPLLLSCNRSMPGADVILDPDTQQRLDPLGGDDPGPVPDSRDIFVLLNRIEIEQGREQVTVRAGDHRVGVLAESDSAAFRAFVEEGARLGRPVVTEASCVRNPDGDWRLSVYRPRSASPG
jgi:hypothetical protein